MASKEDLENVRVMAVKKVTAHRGAGGSGVVSIFEQYNYKLLSRDYTPTRTGKMDQQQIFADLRAKLHESVDRASLRFEPPSFDDWQLSPALRNKRTWNNDTLFYLILCIMGDIRRETIS